MLKILKDNVNLFKERYFYLIMSTFIDLKKSLFKQIPQNFVVKSQLNSFFNETYQLKKKFIILFTNCQFLKNIFI